MDSESAALVGCAGIGAGVGAAQGCTELAILYYEGRAVAKDPARTVTLLEKGCKLGGQIACKNLEVLGRSRPQ